ncbi:hypothetical protein WJX84_001081 [Apatococcus fuscideae]|uniref:Glycosyltransferase family 92 protein n=1 Tax=Apatococcus fuscideae TaxID=2026836 RepID=A0AAW1SCE2_9CHLO
MSVACKDGCVVMMTTLRIDLNQAGSGAQICSTNFRFLPRSIRTSCAVAFPVHRCIVQSRPSKSRLEGPMASPSLTVLWWALLITGVSLPEGLRAAREHAAHGDATSRHLAAATHAGEDGKVKEGSPRLVLCALLKNEVPYMIEWVEFHRLIGFSHIAVYDDGSTDNAMLAEALYRCAWQENPQQRGAEMPGAWSPAHCSIWCSREHGREYLSMRMSEWHEDPRQRRAIACGACFAAFKPQADWIIHADVDEFVWSPKYPHLPDYFLHEVPDHTHILYVGASRFGWEGQHKRYTWALEEVANPGVGHSVQLTNPNGMEQLLTQTHVHRAPDKRFGEPEELLKDSNERCRTWKAEHGRMSPCTNDNENVVGKTFIRGSTAEGIWTHGGSVKVNGEWIQLDNGMDMHTDKCPAPICERSDPFMLHVYHYRNPSIEDMTKKNIDWHWVDDPTVKDNQFLEDTWFFNQVRDVSLERFGDALRARIAPLMTASPQAASASRHHLLN